MQILSEFQFDENNKIQGKYIEAIREKIDPAKLKEANKFAAFVVKDAQTVGKDVALEIKTPFDELQLLDQNRVFVFENMPTIKNFKILKSDDAEEVQNSAGPREQAVPGKPSMMFF